MTTCNHDIKGKNSGIQSWQLKITVWWKLTNLKIIFENQLFIPELWLFSYKLWLSQNYDISCNCDKRSKLWHKNLKVWHTTSKCVNVMKMSQNSEIKCQNYDKL